MGPCTLAPIHESPLAQVIIHLLFSPGGCQQILCTIACNHGLTPSSQIMSLLLFGPKDLLEFHADYGVIICRECRYAIQKSALPSHLLRHKIFRHERHSLLSSISQLNILEPEEVPLPPTTCKPIEALPIMPGFRCTIGECRSLYVSSKRMRQHQLESHDGFSEVEYPVRSVSLQTFFRGTKIKYFEVTPTEPMSETLEVASATMADAEQNADHSDAETQNADADAALTMPLQTTAGSDINMQVLVYFDHFTTATSPTLPPTNFERSPELYWHGEFVTQALQQRWLMAGLLALSAAHMAAITQKSSAAIAHYARSGEYLQEYIQGRTIHTQGPFNTSYKGAPTPRKQVLDQIESILQCALNTSRISSKTLTLDLMSLVDSMRRLVTTTQPLQSSNLPRTEFENLQQDPFDRAAELMDMTVHEAGLSVILHRLNTLPTRMAEALGRPEDLRDVVVALSAIATLIDSCVAGFEAEEATIWAMATWLSKAAVEFHDMIAKNDPAALVILAHWAASLVRKVEEQGCWFLKGASELVLAKLAECLPLDRPAIRKLIEDL